MSQLKAVIFDLDGVLTDTAEYHYLAWKQLAEEEGLSFSRSDNEKLRGVSRRDSLQLILGNRQVAETAMQAMMARKNVYYQQMLSQVSPADLLPGVAALLDELDAASVPYAVASASRNAPDVVARLGLSQRLALVADGSSVVRQKPAPDLFRYAAAKLGFAPAECLVVEDAAAGIAAAVTAGMPALALGPAERFASMLGHQERLHNRADLLGVTLAELQNMVADDSSWQVVQQQFSVESQHHMETVFTIGNGNFATRGSFEERYPGDHPLTLAHGIFDDMPVSFTELVNLPDWLDVALEVDGQLFRLDHGRVHHFRRMLNLHQAILRRDLRWESPDGVVLDLSFERFISYANLPVAGLRVLVTAVNRACTVQVHTGINSHVANGDLLHWRQLAQGEGAEKGVVWWNGRTRHTQIELGMAATLTTSAGAAVSCQNCPGHPRFTFSHTLEHAQTVQIDKLVAVTSSREQVADAANVVGRAVSALQNQSYDALRAAQQAAWQQLWQACDVVIEGDEEAQLAVRFNLFQLLVAAPQQDERVSIGAKTLSGLGYRGHVFWDTEIFILPFFIYAQPELARNMLMYRYHTLAGARQKAADNGYEGAQYAWESAVTGEEVTPTWVPHFSDRTQLIRIWTGDIQIHISADVAYAINQYWRVTGDDAFMRDYGAEMILDAARFWASRAEREETAVGYQYAFRNVIGPDEYHDHVDNNSYTNYVARWHLQTALAIAAWLQAQYPAKANELFASLNLTDDALAHWQEISQHIVFLHDETTGLIDQFEGFFDLEQVSPQFIAEADQSLQVIFGIEGANKRQVLKQADVIMLLCLFREQFDRKTWQTNWDTYMPKTDHVYGSSLGPSFHAWAACEMDRPEEAYEHFMLAARADLRNPRGNAGDGIHAASAGGVWQALAFGFAGLRLTEDGYTLNPRLPTHWRRLSFNFYLHGAQHTVDIRR
jgi:beta-phosphoglucomutase